MGDVHYLLAADSGGPATLEHRARARFRDSSTAGSVLAAIVLLAAPWHSASLSRVPEHTADRPRQAFGAPL